MSKEYIICDEKFDMIACGTFDQIDDTFGLTADRGDDKWERQVLLDFVKTQNLFPFKLQLYVCVKSRS